MPQSFGTVPQASEWTHIMRLSFASVFLLKPYHTINSAIVPASKIQSVQDAGLGWRKVVSLRDHVIGDRELKSLLQKNHTKK